MQGDVGLPGLGGDEGPVGPSGPPGAVGLPGPEGAVVSVSVHLLYVVTLCYHRDLKEARVNLESKGLPESRSVQECNMELCGMRMHFSSG